MVARFSSAGRFLQHVRSMIRPERRNLPAGDRSDLPAGEASYLSCALCTCESLEAGEIHIQSESVRCYVRLPERSKLLDASTSNSIGVFFDGAGNVESIINRAGAISDLDWQRIDESVDVKPGI